jgi:ferredoxin--NADP+ reductase
LTETKNTAGIESLLKSGHHVIDQVGWEKINASEVILGELVGKPRQKICDRNKLVKIALR